MSKEVIEMICAMKRKSIEMQLALQCAPALAGLKTSNLLIVPREDEDKVRYILRHLGILGYRLVYDRRKVIFLVFNRDMLEDYLGQADVKRFLADYGYKADSFGYILRTFQSRYEAYIEKRMDFPHEIGVILGYPLCDVTGFIDNGGQSYLYAGYWKVYDNVDATEQLFASFDAVKDEMVLALFKGQGIATVLKNYNDELSCKKAV